FRADARAALERARQALAAVPAARAGGRDTYYALLGLLTEGEALFAYLIAVSGACEKMPGGGQHARQVTRAARLLAGMGERLRNIGGDANEARWTRVSQLQLRVRRLARRLESALPEPVKLKSDFELVDFTPVQEVPPGFAQRAALMLAR
ncbi:hypothetical protein JNB70_25105, partial [Rhizobium pusense]|nr:hypothetical protein [Agrobacterium pusense]